MKKYLAGLLITSFIFVGTFSSVTKVSAAELSIRDLVQLLILVGVITPDKITAVNQFLDAIDDSQNRSTRSEPEEVRTTPAKPIPVKPVPMPVPVENRIKLPTSDIELEQTLRGPATFSKAQADCRADGLKLPTWTEAISTNVNPSDFLTKPGHNDEGRIWTGSTCGYEERHATAWNGLPKVVKDGSDTAAFYSHNNCTEDNKKHYYQCVADDTAAVETVSYESLGSIFWQKSGDVPSEGNSVTNPTSNIYYNPRIVLNGREEVPFHNSDSAVEWCKNVPDQDYNRGESRLGGDNPTVGARYSFDGSGWVKHSSGNYPRMYVCN